MQRGDDLFIRIGVLLHLIQYIGAGSIGRTAAMKYMYLLQILKNIPLGYEFRLYHYGPFSPEVLTDIEYAESLGALNTSVVHFASGYKYKISPGESAKNFTNNASKFIKKYQRLLNWLGDEFGGKTASELELISTLVFIDRKEAIDGKQISTEELAQKVQNIKPRFEIKLITDVIFELRDKSLLKALA